MTVVSLEALTFGIGNLVKAADALGERLRLLTRDPDYYRYELERLRPDALDVVEVETFDTAAVTAELDGTPELRGLISSTDTWMLQGAELCARFALPGLDPDVLRLMRDKALVRKRLYAAGLSSGSAVAEEDGEAGEVVGARREFGERVLKEVGLPAVLKDSAGTGSQNVWLLRTEEDLATALREAGERPLKGRLFAEPYLPGPVYSAETLTWAGHTRLLGVSSRLMSPEPYFREEITAFPVAFPAAQLRDLERWLGRVLGATGYTDRFAHIEFAMTLTGPEIIEINPRIGGALVAEGMCRSLGYNVYTAMVETALGREPDLLHAELPGGPAVAFVLGYPRQPGLLQEISGLERLAELPGSPRWYPVKALGDPVEHLGDSRGYAGIVYAEGESAELATHRAVAAAGTVQVRTQPVTGEGTTR